MLCQKIMNFNQLLIKSMSKFNAPGKLQLDRTFDLI